jgi:hypothetical protein
MKLEYRAFIRWGAGLAAMAVAIFLVVVPIGLVAPPAGAAGYPPPLTNTTCSDNAVIPLGQSGSVTLSSPFAPGSAVNLTLNGAAYSTVVAPATTGIETLNFISTLPSDLSINSGPTDSVGAASTVVATGTNSTGGTNTCTVLLSDPSSTSTTPTTAPSTTGTTIGTGSGSNGSGSGSNGSGSTTPTTITKAAAKSSGTLAFTGADILATIVGGLVLLAVGILLVIYARRRSARGTTPA